MISVSLDDAAKAAREGIDLYAGEEPAITSDTLYGVLPFHKIPGGVLAYMKKDCDHILEETGKIVNKDFGPNYIKHTCTVCKGESWSEE